MQSDEERTLSNLHVLAAVSHNDKLCTKDDLFDIATPTTWRGAWRMWYGERRDHNIERIRFTVRAAIQFATKTKEEVQTLEQAPSSATPLDPHPRLDHMMQWRGQTIQLQHERMVDALRNSLKGLENLLTTYRDDAALSSRIVLIQREIEDFLRVIRLNASSGSATGSSVEASPSSVKSIPERLPSPLSIASSVGVVPSS